MFERVEEFGPVTSLSCRASWTSGRLVVSDHTCKLVSAKDRSAVNVDDVL
jgi:hypothetical protein